MPESPTIDITERAIERIRTIAERDRVDAQTTFLRVAVVPGGCSGLSYDLGWDAESGEADQRLDADGFQVVLDRRSALYLDGTTLDFTDGLQGQGFHFKNPMAARTCACGDSFSL